MNKFDLIIIGAGPGGYTAALKAAALNKSVCLIEEGSVGGTCLNRGCIPTKALLRAAEEYQTIKNAEAIGVSAENISFNFDEIHQFANATVEKLRGGIELLLQKAKVTVIVGRAHGLEKGSVKVDDAMYFADNIIIATGSVPAMPPIPGIANEGVVTSDTMLTKGGVSCKSLIIIGGGVVGAEFAQFYNNLGCTVTVIEAMPKILPQLDREISQNLAMIFKKRGIALHTNSVVTAIEKSNEMLICHYTENDTSCMATGQAVLVCTGRSANTKGLISEGLSLGAQRGFIPTNSNGKTAVEGIYAIGDAVMGTIQLAHAAQAMGENAVCDIYGIPQAKEMLIPACVFTQPEIACVGLTADEAKAKGLAVQAVKGLTSANGKAIIQGAERGFVKLVYLQESGKLIGAQLMCPHASEMIGGITAAINAGITRSVMEGTVFPHPTVSETILG